MTSRTPRSPPLRPRLLLLLCVLALGGCAGTGTRDGAGRDGAGREPDEAAKAEPLLARAGVPHRRLDARAVAVPASFANGIAVVLEGPDGTSR